MNLSHRALALAVVGMTVFCAVAASAAATAGGHFVMGPEQHSRIFGAQRLDHRIEFVTHPMEGGIVCDSVVYTSTVTAATVEALDLEPTYGSCHTTSGAGVTIDTNGCYFRMTAAKGTGDQTEQTIHIICAADKAIAITHGNCTITIPGQYDAGGATYTTFIDNTTAKLTVDTGMEFPVQFHAGICVFLGTNHVGTLDGSIVVSADKTSGATQNLAAT